MGATGLADPKMVKKYVAAVMKARPGWAGMTDEKRVNVLAESVSLLLAELGVPQARGLIDPLRSMAGTGERAAFTPATWQIRFNPDQLNAGTDQAFGQLANTTYHEARHAEQAFRVARKLATDGQNAAQIAAALSIPKNCAELAVAAPLSKKKSADEWREAEAWQLNLMVEGGKSRADLINEQKKRAITEYDTARLVWRSVEKAVKHDPTAMPDIVEFCRQKLAQDGPAKMKEFELAAQKRYMIARVMVEQTYLAYAKMPVEEDAWATGGLVEAELGLTVSTPEAEVRNLDADERTMYQLKTLSSDDAQKLLNAIKKDAK